VRRRRKDVKDLVKRLVKALLPLVDVLLLPFVFLSAWILKGVRRAGVQRLPVCKRALLAVGVFPIRGHYYEPQFDYRDVHRPLSEDRQLPGIDWNVAGQLEVLAGFKYSSELADIPQARTRQIEFHFNNGAFESGDAEYWYQLVRSLKPRRIYEVGSGNSTLMAIRAIEANRRENPQYRCKHVCVEPYEMPWLEKADVSVIRKKIEDVEPGMFQDLEANDVLFIDSSHVIRPQGDVLVEYLEILPRLKTGVIVHVHDVFSPRNYPKLWMEDQVRFWNEQYVLEAFLSHNGSWKILGALNYLHQHHYEKFKAIAPYVTPSRDPGSFYIQRIA